MNSIKNNELNNYNKRVAYQKEYNMDFFKLRLKISKNP